MPYVGPILIWFWNSDSCLISVWFQFVQCQSVSGLQCAKWLSSVCHDKNTFYPSSSWSTQASHITVLVFNSPFGLCVPRDQARASLALHGTNSFQYLPKMRVIWFWNGIHMLISSSGRLTDNGETISHIWVWNVSCISCCCVWLKARYWILDIVLPCVSFFIMLLTDILSQ